MVLRQARSPVDEAAGFWNDALHDEREHGEKIRFEEIYRVDEEFVRFAIADQVICSECVTKSTWLRSADSELFVAKA